MSPQTTGQTPPAPEVATGPLGRNYLKLWTASTVSNLGDGIDNAALPLLAEALTRDPLLFAGVATANRLPWLLFSLHAGAIADRVDRRKLMVVSNAIRFVLMGALGLAVLTDTASIWLLYLVALGLGTFEVLFDNAAQALMPAVVSREQLEKANGRLFAGEIVTNQFAGPPLGALLFGVAASLPILLDAGTFLVSATLIAMMSGDFHRRRRAVPPRPVAGAGVTDGDPVASPTELAPGADPSLPLDARTDADAGTREGPSASDVAPGPVEASASPRMRTEIAEGLRWLWQHRLLRTLAILLAAMNGTGAFGAAILALYAVGEGSVLGLDAFGWGLLLTAGAAGSFAASFVAERVVARFGRSRALWMTLLSAVVVPLGIGLTSRVGVVVAAQVLYGFAAVLWNVITVSLRQSIIPDDLLGRVNSVYRFLGWGAIPVGSLLGGVIASGLGLRAPWIAAAVVMAIALLAAVGTINDRTIDAARAATT
ncbi:MFS transporter [Egicoccus halophilus]|uniref:MFS transporter n=1 Tax=Egicoccus halophilus TaxID=1670830 RepID=UPI0013EE9841|nr:MFS transporter [Egicoccus halophilus]